MKDFRFIGPVQEREVFFGVQNLDDEFCQIEAIVEGFFLCYRRFVREIDLEIHGWGEKRVVFDDLSRLFAGKFIDVDKDPVVIQSVVLDALSADA